jgi:hypothetical protein
MISLWPPLLTNDMHDPAGTSQVTERWLRLDDSGQLRRQQQGKLVPKLFSLN